MKKRRKLFYYDYNGRFACDRANAKLISEIKLPGLSEDPRLVGKCAFDYFDRGMREIPVGTVLDLVFGDPIVLKRCKALLLVTKDVPRVARKWSKISVFRYKRKRFWVMLSWCCRLENILKD